MPSRWGGLRLREPPYSLGSESGGRVQRNAEQSSQSDGVAAAMATLVSQQFYNRRSSSAQLCDS